jgi:hypothetical protein
MRTPAVATLLLLNIALLAGIAVTAFSPAPAAAQLGGAARNYTMISGSVLGRKSQDVIYIVDLNTSAIVPLFYNGASRKFEIFEGSVVSSDLDAALTPRR